MERKLRVTLMCLGVLAVGFMLSACGGGGSSGDSSSDDPQTPPSNVIISLSAEPNSPGSVALSWDAVGNQRYYWVFMDGYLYTQIYQFTPPRKD